MAAFERDFVYKGFRTYNLDGYRCIAVDLVGHGRSPSPADLAPYSVGRRSRRRHGWRAVPRGRLFDGRPRGAAEWQASVRQRMTCDPVGLANSLRAAGTGAMTPLWDRLANLAVPTLVLCGELDAKFVAIGREMAALLPRSELAVLDGIGHTAHLEEPDACAAAIRQHLAAH